MNNEGLESWKKGYTTDQFYSKGLNVFPVNGDKDGNYPQYQVIEGLIYFKDWNGNLQLCIPASLRVEVVSEVHNVLTESAYGGHAKTYNHIASLTTGLKYSKILKNMSSPATFAVSYTPPHIARDSLGTPYNPWGLLVDSLRTPWGLRKDFVT